MKGSARGSEKNGAERAAPGMTGLLNGWNAAETGKPLKRSLTIAGHRTAVSLEEPFWEALRLIAVEMRAPIARLVAEIDTVRGKTSLSSAIRVFVLDHYRLPHRGSGQDGAR